MIQEGIALSLLGLTLITPVEATPTVNFAVVFQAEPLASQSMDMTNRYPDKWVNEVFSDNILLNLHYLNDPASVKDMINKWDKVREPFKVEFNLKPGEVFAFHDSVLPEFKDEVVKTTNAHFIGEEGFKSDGWLIGDGVCHLATFMNWVASEANLQVTAKVNHDFRPVPGIDRKFGTAIFAGNPDQNLYIKNTLEYPVKFEFKADSKTVSLSISKSEAN